MAMHARRNDVRKSLSGWPAHSAAVLSHNRGIVVADRLEEVHGGMPVLSHLGIRGMIILESAELCRLHATCWDPEVKYSGMTTKSGRPRCQRPDFFSITQRQPPLFKFKTNFAMSSPCTEVSRLVVIFNLRCRHPQLI